MAFVIDFARDVWSRSAERIRRADPLLMGAAIAYNGLFALVPLAFAFAAMLTFIDRPDDLMNEVYQSIDKNLPPELAAFLREILQSSLSWVQGQAGPILAISIVIALWSGSRAVYAIQKALRTVEALEETRGYFRTRALGIVVTVGAGAAVLAAYLILLAGSQMWSAVVDAFGIAGANAIGVFGVTLAIVWVWLLLWVIYRWGPPVPLRHAGAVAAAVGALIVIGSIVAFALVPQFGTSSTLSFLGAVGLLLLWLYYVGIVIVAAPTVVSAFAGAIGSRVRR